MLAARFLRPVPIIFGILIVEDKEENWILLERILQGAGFQVKVAENGQDAVDQFASWRPHFIWMDVRIPGINGVEAATRIRNHEGGSKVKIAAVGKALSLKKP